MKLYVGKLVFQTSREDLEQMFSQAGTVESASVVEDRETGRSRDFGFVDMSTKEEGEAAIAQFSGKKMGGRVHNVYEATSTSRGRVRGFGGKRQGRVHGGTSDTGEEFGVIEIIAEDDGKSAAHMIVFGSAQDGQVAQYFTDIAESRKRAHKMQTQINRVKKKTLAILDELS